jgi:hypothetical protein
MRWINGLASCNVWPDGDGPTARAEEEIWTWGKCV